MHAGGHELNPRRYGALAISVVLLCQGSWGDAYAVDVPGRPRPLDVPSAVYVDSGERAPLPGPADLDAARRLIDDVFGEELAAGRRGLARQFLHMALEDEEDPASRYALLEQAASTAVAARDAEAAVRAVEALAMYFVVDPLPLKKQRFAEIAKIATTREGALALAEAYLTLADEAIEVEQFDDAALAATESGRLAQMFSPSQVKLDQARLFKVEFERARDASAVRQDNPADPEANLTLGRYLCFFRGEWERGLGMLVLGADKVLAELARLELGPPADASHRVALGDRWWEAAEAQQGVLRALYQARAVHWYDSAAPDLGALAKARVEDRAASAEQPPWQTGIQSIIVEAYIDEIAKLCVTPGGLYWLVDPGRRRPCGGTRHAAVVNGREWRPVWGNPRADRGPDRSEPFPLRVGSVELGLQVLAVTEQQGGEGIQDGCPMETYLHQNVLTVYAPDGKGGGRWYRFRLFRGPGGIRPMRRAAIVP